MKVAEAKVQGRPVATLVERDLRPGKAGWLKSALRFALRKPVGAASALVLAILVFVAIFADVLAPYEPTVNDSLNELASPSADHLAGTDQFGRDVLSRVIHGSRISLYVGLGATLIAVAGASLIGLASAYFGGIVDVVLQRIVDTIQSIPSLVLLISILVVLGPGLTNVLIALSIRSSFTQSRVVRGSVLSVQASPFVDSARAIGAGDLRIIFRHILPNIVPVLIVLASLDVGANILAEASLSFLGFGVPPPAPSWGGMMAADGRTYMILAPWTLIAPTVALALVVFSLNMFGDALRDTIDPRLRQQ